MCRNVALWILSVTVTVTVFIARPGVARAADDELIVAVGPGYGLVLNDAPLHGPGGTLSTWLGLTDALWLGLSGGAFAFADHRAEEDSSAVVLWEAMGGLIAAFDVFRWVPYFEGQVGLVGRGNTRVPTARFGLGVDYLMTPDWFVGAAGRFRPLAGPLGSLKITVGFRAGMRFEL